MTVAKKIARGFALPELLAYVAVLAIVLAVLATMVIWFFGVGTKIESKQTVSFEAKKAMEKIVSEIKQAKAIDAVNSVFDQDLGRLSLKKDGENTIDFYILDSKLYSKTNSEDPILMMPETVLATVLRFSSVGGQMFSLQISLAVNYRNPKGRPEKQAETRLDSIVSLRNY